MRHGLFILFALTAFCVAVRASAAQDALNDYKKIIDRLQAVIPTLDEGGEEALNNLVTVRRIMAIIYDRLKNNKNDLPKLAFNPIEKLETTMQKVDSLVEARRIILNAAKATTVTDDETPKEPKSAEEKKEAEEKEKEKEEETPKIPCTVGACCDLKKGFVFALGTGCNVTDVCLEPASLCTGAGAECETSHKPEGTICGEGKACYKGVCERNKELMKMDREAEMIKVKEKALLKKKAAHRLLKLQKKKEEKKEKSRQMKSLLKRFAVFSWMDNKANTWEADIEAGDYVQTLKSAPKHEEIFQHNFVGDTNRFFNDLSEVPHEYDLDSSSSEVNTTASATQNLQSGLGGGATTVTFVGIFLIGIALVLIIAYLVTGRKKKAPAPRTIY